MTPLVEHLVNRQSGLDIKLVSKVINNSLSVYFRTMSLRAVSRDVVRHVLENVVALMGFEMEVFELVHQFTANDVYAHMERKRAERRQERAATAVPHPRVGKRELEFCQVRARIIIVI